MFSQAHMFNYLIKSFILGLCFIFISGCASGKKAAKRKTTPTQTVKPIPNPHSTEELASDGEKPEPAEAEVDATPEKPSFYSTHEVELAKTPREFRGVWIATIGNIDWPTSSIDPFAKQKADFTKLLDYYQTMNFNAVIVQVRTAGDAFYPSKFAPWSRYLTGKEGQKPQTTEDPLAWMISEVHKRGMEFHAWFNPYRATVDLDTRKLSPEHDYFKHPDWMIKYSTKYYYNPAIPEVQQHLKEVIREVVENYDIDAIHFDDYFYPYVVDKVVFQDAASFKKYGRPGQKLEDWRRENVNTLVKSVHDIIESTKPWVQFGISPFGVWRNIDKDPLGSKTRAGQTNFDHLYADPITWMRQGWIDYLIPQLYWSMDYNLASYRELISWWSRNSHNTKIYIGNGPYKIRNNADKAWDNPMEIPNQITLTRATPQLSGNAFFSAKSLYQKNRDVSNIIANDHYFQPAFTPAFDAENHIPKETVTNLAVMENGYSLEFEENIRSEYRYLVIYTGTSLKDIINKTDPEGFKKIPLSHIQNDQFQLPENSLQKYIAVSFLDYYGRESKATVFEIHSVR